MPSTETRLEPTEGGARTYAWQERVSLFSCTNARARKLLLRTWDSGAFLRMSCHCDDA